MTKKEIRKKARAAAEYRLPDGRGAFNPDVVAQVEYELTKVWNAAIEAATRRLEHFDANHRMDTNYPAEVRALKLEEEEK